MRRETEMTRCGVGVGSLEGLNGHYLVQLRRAGGEET
jgi:hypothetical protein